MDCESSVEEWPVVVVHGLAEAVGVLALARPVCLLSAAGAARAGGVLWWRAVMAQARAAVPGAEMVDVLDCGSAPGLAMAALRAGQLRLALDAEVAAWPRVAAAAASLGAVVLAHRPDALDLAERGAFLRLSDHLRVQAPS
jgi:hypothetical protein